SVLNFVPKREDNGVYLICRAENIRLANSALEDRLKLDVYYEPIANVALRISNKLGFVKENDQIWLECRANAKPNASDFVWLRNDELLNEDRRKDPPICKANQKFVYGIGLGETARVLCDVDAYPIGVKFFWTINDTQSPLNQKYPVNRAPQAVSNCQITESSEDSVSINCDPGYDGGLEQIFHLEVYQIALNDQNLILLRNLTNKHPSFRVAQLQASTNYHFNVYSSNIKGKSVKTVRLKAKTSKTKTSLSA
ncbi:uncharacterized protein B4U79_13493, partial [Dinothrombium tinctorium]